MDHAGRPRRPLARRLGHALAEAAADPQAAVIVSGGSVRGRPAEGPVMRDWLVAAGMDAARIVVEAEARSTSENALNCARLIAAGGFRRVTLVTERFHMLRARVLLARALARGGVRVDLRISAAPDHLGAFRLIARWLGELAKLADDVRQKPRI